MARGGDPWYTNGWVGRSAQGFGILELVAGLALLVLKHDEAQGYALLAIGAATLSSMPWMRRPRSG